MRRKDMVNRVSMIAACLLLSCGGSLRAHPAAMLEQLDYPIVAGFENFFILEDSEEYLARGGELLLSELNCVACHAPESESLSRRIPGRRAPDLSGVGSRLSPRDLRFMVRNPRHVKQGTTMPTLFASSDRDLSEIEALTSYLVSRKAPVEMMPAGDKERGKDIYHAVGCVACHAMEERARPARLPEGEEPEIPGFPSVPIALAYLYEETALAQFLENPLEVRPSGRMPGMKLSSQQAADVARYLKAWLPPASPDPYTLNEEQVARGEALFFEKGCAACHQRGEDPRPGAPSFTALESLDPRAEKSCLSESPQKGAIPYYYLDFIQIEAISLALERIAAGEADVVLSAPERIDRVMTKLNCYACHERDGKGGMEPARAIWFPALDPAAPVADELEIATSLTLVGSRHERSQLESLVGAHGDEVPAVPALRMPRYGDFNLKGLAGDLAEVDR